MNKEEKQVLETFKSGLGLTSAEREILVNYIEKLQKENEELKEDNRALCEMAFIKPIQLPYSTPIFTSTNEFVSKDKIKNVVNNFIEEMNKLLEE